MLAAVQHPDCAFALSGVPGGGVWARLLVMMRGTATIMAAVRNRNAVAGDTVVHRIPATALAARLAAA